MNLKLLAIIASLITSLTAGSAALGQTAVTPAPKPAASSVCSKASTSTYKTQTVSKVCSRTPSSAANCSSVQNSAYSSATSSCKLASSSACPPASSQSSTPAASLASSSDISTAASRVPTSSTASFQTAVDYSAFQNEVVTLVNQQRVANGLSTLSVNSQLAKTATLKSEDMAKLNYFDHTSPTYGTPFAMMQQFGISYRTAGENIAMGQTSPAQVMNSWMNSEGHRKNILNASFTQIGVGIAKNANGQYIWTQQFIG